MQLPFSHDQFLAVFGAYNTLLWPGAALLWVLTAGWSLRWLLGWPVQERTIFALLAVHWLWSGAVYHWLFFREINPAAALFAVLFVLQAAFFVWRAVGTTRYIPAATGLRGVVGAALVLYGLLYPAIGLLFGLEYPRLPTFGVPCPTTLVTVGLLIAAVRAPRWIAVLPVAWAAVGTSAAFVLDVRADLALAVAGALLTLNILMPTALGPSRTRPHLGSPTAR